MVRRILPRPLLALAGVALAFTRTTDALELGVDRGVGPDGFESIALDAGHQFQRLPLRVDAGYYSSDIAGQGVEQSTASIRWQVRNEISTTLGLSHIDDNVFVIRGTDLGLGLAANALWHGSRTTQLNLTYGRLTYSPDAHAPFGPGVLARLPRQVHCLTGVSQQFSDKFWLNLSYDSFQYSKSPLELAQVLLILNRRYRTPLTWAYTMIAFPDRAGSAGLVWYPSQKYSATLTYSRSHTVLLQSTSATAANVTRNFGRFNATVGLNHSDAGPVRGFAGQVLQPASSGTYFDLHLGASF